MSCREHARAQTGWFSWKFIKTGFSCLASFTMEDEMGRCESDVMFPQNNINRVSRLLRREQNSLFNCLSSLHHDSSFVEEIALLYPTVPLLANLRCGLWYTPNPAGTCYFKSTDGHNGNWSFSTMRLNWNVCEQAAAHGGVLIVDATRKGKRFPVSLAAVIRLHKCV